MKKKAMERSDPLDQRIETIATELVLLDSSDPRACTRVYDMLGSLAEEPSATDKIRSLAKQATEAARKLIFAEYDSPEAGSKELEHLISRMQALSEDREIPDSHRGEEPERPVSESANQQLLDEFLDRQQDTLCRFEKKWRDLSQGNPDALTGLLHMIATWTEESALLGLSEIPA
ncbi:MAG: hypothetical protein FJY66_01060, partial [Calditrichaeota bacterium]|nr:hypothetical protein [Calditrichota bacterium]